MNPQLGDTTASRAKICAHRQRRLPYLPFCKNICKMISNMQTNRKSVLAAKQLGDALRHRRKELGLTLEQLASKLNVDVGQLSRFERAEFKIVSQNLQKVAAFLQIQVDDGVGEPDCIVEQFAELLGRSARHRAAAIALVRALQELR
ncbi:hypothetical protein B7G54_34755 [Burkholderia puraquae]|uniref:HTH cro/C1-type domain-containing protein n=1 Tax=Burkholderia puraquae TaxID=1904757 RepID=A0A1X1P6G7_9BURK|nr:helix-turn-helix transcriptional regulator [Burkholderia puraquae]ORT80262.1 hypothetical protein B7G54_34755 [Burkholderia puraquae]